MGPLHNVGKCRFRADSNMPCTSFCSPCTRMCATIDCFLLATAIAQSYSSWEPFIFRCPFQGWSCLATLPWEAAITRAQVCPTQLLAYQGRRPELPLAFSSPTVNTPIAICAKGSKSLKLFASPAKEHRCTMSSALLKPQTSKASTSAATSARTTTRRLRLPVSAAATVNKTDKQAKRQPRQENVGLESKKAFYVDHTCIDCDTCRWIAPEFFGRENEQSAMIQQPESEADRVLSFQALVSCPTFSIHARENAELKEAVARYPEPVEGAQGVYYCGYNSERSFGGSAWLIQRESGNVMVDSPRFDPKLVKNIKALGGVKYIFLTHRDDVADHALWAKEFGAERIIHESECNSQQGTDECEIKLEGEEPWQFPGAADDLEIIHTPGHTYGHIVLLHKPSRTLFTGDHLAFSREPAGVFRIHKTYNWYSVPEQVESVRKLLQYDFVHICPGHGRPGHLKDAAHRKELINDLLASENAL